MSDVKSPFYLVPEFVSHLMCEEIVDSCNFTVPDKNKEGKNVKTIRTSETAEQVLYDRLMAIMPAVEQHYGMKYRGTERMSFEWFPSGTVGEFICENSQRLREKWVRTKNRDFTAILFLSEFQDNPQFDQDFEVYGGRLEVVQHKFSFRPNIGSLVIFPSDPHFINITTEVLAGEAHQVRIQIAAEGGYKYEMKNFPGNYTVWF